MAKVILFGVADFASLGHKRLSIIDLRTGQQPMTCTASCAWEAVGAPCMNQTCVDGACAGVCAPGQTECAPSPANAVQTCDATGNWTTATPCMAGQMCVSGACQ